MLDNPHGGRTAFYPVILPCYNLRRLARLLQRERRRKEGPAIAPSLRKEACTTIEGTHMEGKMKQRFFIFFILAFCLGAGPASAALTITFAHGEPEDQTYGVYASMLAHKLQTLSGGDIRCTIFANGTMGSELELGQKVQQGTLNMALVSSTNVGALAPSANILNLPYLFDSPDSLMGEKGYLRSNSPFFQALSERILKESGRLRLLGAGTNGFRLLFSKPHPVTSLEELKGLKLRLPPSPVLQRTWEAWGAAAYPIAWSETFTAIQQGVADAYESPLDTLLKSGFYPYTRYVTENLTYAPQSFLLLVNEKWFARLSEEQKKLLRQAASENDTEHFHWVQVQEEDIKKALEGKGVTFYRVTDAERWQAIAMRLWPEFVKICGGETWVDQVLRFKRTGSF